MSQVDRHSIWPRDLPFRNPARPTTHRVVVGPFGPPRRLFPQADACAPYEAWPGSASPPYTSSNLPCSFLLARGAFLNVTSTRPSGNWSFFPSSSSFTVSICMRGYILLPSGDW